MIVPSTIKSLFDSVPLHTYKEESLLAEVHHYPFLPDFTVAVFNVFQCNGHMIPTDPISLATVLVLAHKNGLKLPTESDRGRGGIITTSFWASPTNVLPMLIEDQKIITLDEINNTISAKLDEPTKLIYEMLSTKLYDIWIMCILCEDIPISNIFGIDSLSKLDLMSVVPTWNNFAVRHPNLSGKSLTNFYKALLTELESDLDLLASCNHPIIQHSLAGYVIIIDQLLKSTKLGQIVSQHQSLLASCYSLLNLHTSI